MGMLILVSRIGRDQERVTISGGEGEANRRVRELVSKRVKVIANENPIEDTEKQRQERHPNRRLIQPPIGRHQSVKRWELAQEERQHSFDRRILDKSRFTVLFARLA
jgi:hypothetical protein